LVKRIPILRWAVATNDTTGAAKPVAGILALLVPVPISTLALEDWTGESAISRYRQAADYSAANNGLGSDLSIQGDGGASDKQAAVLEMPMVHAPGG